MIGIKFWVFRYYWWIFLVLLVISIVYTTNVNQDQKILLPSIGILLSFIYFLQKQRLEEMRLFREIFTNCNERYDVLNESLMLIIINNSGKLSKEDTYILIDYFNLCAEEYLYYSQGYILPDVWDAWYKGMCFYLQDERILKLWEIESKTDSYYGLDFSLCSN